MKKGQIFCYLVLTRNSSTREFTLLQPLTLLGVRLLGAGGNIEEEEKSLGIYFFGLNGPKRLILTKRGQMFWMYYARCFECIVYA